jgi:class 3 adenylate cyclase
MIQHSKKNFDDYLDAKKDNIENVIHELWISKDSTLWSKDPYFYIKLGETADKLGQTMFAHDIVLEGLQHFPEELRLNQLFGLSLIKCGFLSRAKERLSVLVRKGNEDEETLGLLGRVYKDMWLISGEDPYLKKSRNLYFQAFKRSSGYYSGINAASLSLMIGDTETAGRLATIVLKICLTLLKKPENRDYWCLATIGEAFLDLGRYNDASKYFTLAKSTGGKNYSYLASTKKQLTLLSQFIDIPPEVHEIISIPPVIAFTGHMIDRPQRKSPRFPPGLERSVQEEIEKRLKALDSGIGYSSCACGSDILFLEMMQKRKAETNIVLPFELDDFYATSVTFAGEGWKNRLDDVLVKSSSVLFATEGKYSGDDLLFDYTNRILMGKAILQSELLQTDPVLLCVWDKKRGKKQGGTAQLVDVWQRKKLPLEVVDISILKETVSVPQATAPSSEETPRAQRAGGRKKKVKRTVKAMLFADLVGFSTFKEEQFPGYINDYLGSLAENLRRFGDKPLFKNIWGDALYFVFEDLLSAAHYALQLRDFVKNTDWSRSGLPSDLNIRIGLHAGPVFCAREPILGRTNYFGNHVNRAARIEPITNPGNVYASEQFASLLLAQSDSDIECKYVGIIVLPKRFGNYPIYHIKRRNEIE